MNSMQPKTWSMAGGIQLAANKQQSLQGPIRTALLPPQLIVPVTQPDYSQPQLCVQVGERVQKGQPLVCVLSAQGLAAHAPAAGIVTAITTHAVPTASGLPELCVVIDTDAADTSWHKLPPLDYMQSDIDTVIQRVAESGISGLGGAGFPAHQKLRSSLGKVDTLILNAAECEPYLTADEALLRERAMDVLDGCLILLRITGASRCLIGIEDNKPQALAALRSHAGDPRLHIRVIPAKYPSGADRLLIHALTGTAIPASTLPIDCGVLCHNVGTVFAIARAVLHGEPLLSRITTITGAAVQQPANYEALIGTPIRELLPQSAVDTTRLSQLVCGGPMMGTALANADLPVTRTANCIIAATEPELPLPQPAQACIRCGFCAEVCPVQLLPQQLYWFARNREHARALAHNLADCIECGACAHVCPSHIPLVQYYRATKAEIAEANDKQQRAHHWKLRFDAHQQRKAVEKVAEEQRRAERAVLASQKQQSGTAATLSARDAVAAALARVQAKKAAGDKLASGSVASSNVADDNKDSRS